MPQPRRLKDDAIKTVVDLLSQRGCSQAAIDRGLDFADIQGAFTTKEAFVLAMSRITCSDNQLAAGIRFEP